MKSHPVIAFVFAVMIVSLVSAHEGHNANQMTPGRDVSQVRVEADPAAAGAVAAVDRFWTALGAGDIGEAAAELDRNVLVLESGGVERSRDEYLAEHAQADATFLKGAHVVLNRRSAHASGDLAWVASESSIHAMKGNEMLMIDSTETMVLRKAAEGWKIVHIHWSSRRASEQGID